MNRKTYLISDSRLIVHGAFRAPGDFNFDQALLNSLKRTMKKAGYTFRQDVSVAKLIRRNYFAGRKDDVHFVCEANPNGVSFEFYEDVIRDNKCGGRYHFDKMAKMPYLRRTKVRLVHEKLVARLEILGYTDATPVQSSRAAAFVWQKRAELIASHGESMYARERNYYDTDADGVRIVEGELRYFRGYGGHLKRGEAWQNINNMWWVICHPGEVHNVACFDLFTYSLDKHKRREIPNTLSRMETKLERMVKNQEFEKAIGLRDAIRKAAPKPPAPKATSLAQ